MFHCLILFFVILSTISRLQSSKLAKIRKYKTCFALATLKEKCVHQSEITKASQYIKNMLWYVPVNFVFQHMEYTRRMNHMFVKLINSLDPPHFLIILNANSFSNLIILFQCQDRKTMSISRAQTQGNFPKGCGALSDNIYPMEIFSV